MMRNALPFLFALLMLISPRADAIPFLPVETMEFIGFRDQALYLSAFAEDDTRLTMQAFFDEIERHRKLTNGLLLAYCGYVEAYFLVRNWEHDLGPDFAENYARFMAMAYGFDKVLSDDRIAPEERALILKIASEWKKYDARAIEIVEALEQMRLNKEQEARPASALAAAVLPALAIDRVRERPPREGSPSSPTSPDHKRSRRMDSVRNALGRIVKFAGGSPRQDPDAVLAHTDSATPRSAPLLDQAAEVVPRSDARTPSSEPGLSRRVRFSEGSKP